MKIGMTAEVIEGDITISRALFEKMSQNVVMALIWAGEAIAARGDTTPTDTENFMLSYAMSVLIEARPQMMEKTRTQIDRLLAQLTGQKAEDLKADMDTLTASINLPDGPIH